MSKPTIKKDNSNKIGITRTHKQKAQDRRERNFAKRRAKRKGHRTKRAYLRSLKFPGNEAKK